MKIDFILCNKKGDVVLSGEMCSYRDMDISLYEYFKYTHKAYEYIMKRGYYLIIHNIDDNDKFTFGGETLFKYYKLFCVCYCDKDELL